ncbi:N-acetyltransferase family protein [Desulfovibrio sp. OttesenSCG-928-C06]|nr:N-acetyltransferase family protein [Desulfovibrio sp. OttesenSCG-928-C06]
MTGLSIRPARLDDARDILDIYAYYVESTVISFEVQTPSLDEFRQRMAGIMDDYPYLVCECAGKLVGFAYSHRHMERAAYQWNAELSVYLDKDFTGRGAGKAMYRALIGISRLQGLHNLYACLALPNPASEGLHRSLGFQPCGVFPKSGYKFGAWRDMGWFGLRIAGAMDAADGSEAAPAAPIPMSALDAAKVGAVLKDAVSI